MKSKLFAMLLVILATACGSESKKKPGTPEEADGPTADKPSTEDHTGHQESDDSAVGFVDEYTTRARWTIGVNRDADHLSLSGSESFPISGTVAPLVNYTVDPANFHAPAEAKGIASYGTLDVSALEDNNLRICGSAQTSRCTKAIIRIYTTGTEKAGLYNSVGKYGLPILSGAGVVGLTVAKAFVHTTYAIPSATRILKLSDISSNGNLQIPIAVDFTNAGAGEYSSTIVIEYALK